MMLNHRKTFVSIVIAINIQPRLNTDEYLMISIMFVLFNCSKLPILIDKITNAITKYLVWNKIRKMGANFCQVINRVSWYFFMFFLMFTNHSWNGEAAIFIIRDAITMFCKIIRLCKFFACIDIIIKIPEAIDWMMKYFILHSIVLFDFLSGMLKIPQKARVFISSVIHTIIQEFLAMQSRGVMRIVIIIKLFVLIRFFQIANLSFFGVKQ